MRIAVILICIALAGCGRKGSVNDSIHPHLSTSLKLQNDILAFTVKNTLNRPTVPLLLRVTVEEHTPQGWSAPELRIQPQPFVLNRLESREIDIRVNPESTEARAHIALRESERGLPISDQTVTVPRSIPSTHAPATPQPPGT